MVLVGEERAVTRFKAGLGVSRELSGFGLDSRGRGASFWAEVSPETGSSGLDGSAVDVSDLSGSALILLVLLLFLFLLQEIFLQSELFDVLGVGQRISRDAEEDWKKVLQNY